MTFKKLGIVDARLDVLPEPQRTVMLQMAATIRELIPGATECISYNLPAFEVEGGVICGIEGYKKHNSYFPFSGSVLTQLSTELANYEMTKGSLHFPLERVLPKVILRRLIRVRLDQIEEKSHKGTGPALSYYDNAVLQSKGKFRKGELHGPWQWWRKDATIMRSGEFKDGIQVGTWWTYDTKGKPYKKTDF